MDEMQLIIDLHKDGYRQGPGSDAATAMAIDMAGLDSSTPLKVADIGCGTGASTLVLARKLNAEIVAIDFIGDFLDILEQRSIEQKVGHAISCQACSMEDLPFPENDLDLIWSEGAIYNIGFERGITEWRRYLKTGGILVASEITWLTADRPKELEDHWNKEYPEIDLASAKIAILEKQGYTPLGYFVLPENCWSDEYYQPMKARFAPFLKQHGNSTQARAMVEAELQEMEMYEQNKAHISYGVYIAQKC